MRVPPKLSATLEIVVSDWVKFCAAGLRSRTALAAENLFLRKQLALFKEREKKTVPTTAADRFVLSKLARFFDWRSALVIVKPATLIGWNRAAVEIETSRPASDIGRGAALNSNLTATSGWTAWENVTSCMLECTRCGNNGTTCAPGPTEE
jgi:hypothetical protein